MENPAFRFLNHSFSSVELNFDNTKPINSIGLKFEPSGIYQPSTGIYTLTFVFKAVNNENDSDIQFAKITCNAIFEFNEKIPLNEIPDFFYPNSIAIVFPYLRAFVGTVSLLANIKPIVLPTLNLSSLKDTLKNCTKVKE